MQTVMAPGSPYMLVCPACFTRKKWFLCWYPPLENCVVVEI